MSYFNARVCPAACIGEASYVHTDVHTTCALQELTYLYVSYDEYDNAAACMMDHSPAAWNHVTFKDVIAKVSNQDVYYRAIKFYLKVGRRPCSFSAVACCFLGRRSRRPRRRGLHFVIPFGSCFLLL